MSSKRVFHFAIATGTVLVWLLALPSSLFSQDYPSRAIHFITPFPPGPADVVIRLYAPKLSQDWGQSAIIENRPGATGTIGTNAVVQATPDGYTLLFTVDLPITMAPNLLKVAYDPQRDLIPITGAGPSMNAILAGDVTMFCAPIGHALGFIRAGNVVPLGVAGPEPSPLLPEVAPLSATFPGLVLSNWFGLLAPAKTPDAIVGKLRDEFQKISADPDIKMKLAAIGFQTEWLAGPAFSKRISDDLVKIRSFIAAANIHAE